MVDVIFFAVFGLVAVVAAIGVVALRNVLYSGLLLVLSMLSLAGLYILMNAQFLGVAQIIVYAGAVMVLFLFAVMLVGGRGEAQPACRLRGQAPLAALMVLILAVDLGLLVYRGLPAAAPAVVLPDGGNVEAVAELLFTRYLWAFEATGLLLLVAVVGVVYLARGGAGASSHD
ncbi:MAG TPA: NADH-quinone oxidoreductase subunit J [Anaerolineae bacterium]|nr:NADH-quinone oxidoreductase subunit J [Anaerolineae bacterium]HOQ98387.1 NADH-quinone oxidoreductase subunit J [Anaerolineae bacterium]HOQ99499.1 NADH-quinone oxidoreductase subunit J [Anaerolineae bacterium]HPL26501.1 NADH-quinone oxidoreductase subunit J [Anaerolineae bacterium]